MHQVMIGLLLAGFRLGMLSTPGPAPDEITLRGHADAVWFVAFSPNGKTLISASKDKTIKLWDVRTGSVRTTIKCDDKPVMSFALSPDGNMLASGNAQDNTIKVWEVRTGKERGTFKAYSGQLATPGVTSVAFSPSGRIIAAGGRDGRIDLWDALTGKEMVRPKAKKFVNDLAFSPDGVTLASSIFGSVTLWDMPTGKEQLTLQGHLGNVGSVAFSPDGRLLASGSWDGHIRIWDVLKAKELATLVVQEDMVMCLAFSPNSKMLASGTSFNHTVDLWDVTTRKIQATFKGHKGPVNSVAFNPDGSIIASASKDWTIKLWKVGKEN